MELLVQISQIRKLFKLLFNLLLENVNCILFLLCVKICVQLLVTESILNRSGVRHATETYLLRKRYSERDTKRLPYIALSACALPHSGNKQLLNNLSAVGMKSVGKVFLKV